jgi:C4-dicarboxylate transporter DctM subunit
MSGLALGLTVFAVMLAFMAIRIPIAISMFLAGVVGYLGSAGLPALGSLLNTEILARFTNYDLTVIPLFILMGNLATSGGISKALFKCAAAAMGGFRGGLAMASVIASAAFGSICGSSVATAATITKVALPELMRHGYSGRLATGVLASGGTLGILIPPSVPLVIYAILAEQNIAKLFAAAMIPGLIAVVGYLCAIAIYVRLFPGHAPTKVDQAEKLTRRDLLAVAPIAAVFGTVFGGIYAGFFTPTEGAAVGAMAMLVAAALKRELTWTGLMEAFTSTAQTSGMIFMIFLGADVMNSAIALTQLPTQLVDWVNSMHFSPMAVVVGILLIYVVLGAVMDELSMLLLTIPVFFPLVMSMDFGMPQESVAIWFGILVLMTVGFGLLAPPVGLNVYVVNAMASRVPITESYRGVMPFLISDSIRTVFLVLFPPITLWFVQFVG